MSDFIPVNLPLLSGNEQAYLAECINTGWISSEGPFVSRFEDAIAEAVNRKYAISVSSGSAALDVAFAALDLAPGDEVIMPTFTIISCVSAVIRAGATPVLVDCEPESWNMNVSAVEARITPKTRAIMAVHIYGLPSDMHPLLELAEQYGLNLIEDAAEAIGQTYYEKPCGGFGDISTFSFYANKHVTTGEGGMVLTDDPDLAARVSSLKNLCFKPEQRFVHDELGWNYRMGNLQAAVGLAQFEQLNNHRIHKRSLGALYTELLGDLDVIQLPPTRKPYAENDYWVFGVVIKQQCALDAREVMSSLAALNVGTRPFFWPMHKQPALHKLGLFESDSFPVSEYIGEKGFYLPAGLGISLDQVHEVAHKVKSVFK